MCVSYFCIRKLKEKFIQEMKKLILLAMFSLAIINLSAAKDAKAEAKTKANVEVAAQDVVVNGLIVDASANETLAGAEITIDGQKIYSDLDGNFIIKNIKPGKVNIKISMISYAEQTLEVDLSSSSKLNVKMKQI